MLSYENIASLLQAPLLASCHLQVHHCVTSTNTLCTEQAQQLSFTSPFICIASQQTAGRGRRGRVWDSPAGAGVYLSIAQHIARLEEWQGLSLAVGVAIVQTLESVLVVNNAANTLQLKWPNDILLDGRKLGGVLIEIVRDVQHRPVLVVGVGLNVCRPTDQQDAPDNPRAYLSEVNGAVLDHNALSAALITTLMTLLQSFASRGFVHWRSEWERYDAYRQREVMLLADAQVTVCGIEQGVNDQGELCVLVDGVPRYISTGEVSLRVVD